MPKQKRNFIIPLEKCFANNSTVEMNASVTIRAEEKTECEDLVILIIRRVPIGLHV